MPMEEEFSEQTLYELNSKRTKMIDDKTLLEVYPPSAAMASLSDLLKMYYYTFARRLHCSALHCSCTYAYTFFHISIRKIRELFSFCTLLVYSFAPN